VEAEFDVTLEDLHALARFQDTRRQAGRRRPGSAWVRSAVRFGLAVLVVVLALLIGLGPWALLGGLLLGALLTAFALLLLVAWLRADYLLQPAMFFDDPRNQWLLATRRVTLTPEEVVITSRHFRDAYPWGVVWDVAATADHVFLLTTTKDGLLIPRRAFRDRQHFEEFVALARRYQAGASTSAAITATPPRPTAITSAPE
jgi:hypothetical protein